MQLSIRINQEIVDHIKILEICYRLCKTEDLNNFLFKFHLLLKKSMNIRNK